MIHIVYLTDVSKKPTYHLVKISDLVLRSPASRGGGGYKKMSDMSCTVADIYIVTWQQKDLLLVKSGYCIGHVDPYHML